MGMHDPESPTQILFQPTVFTVNELSRLAAYRAAIAAGFYTDNCPDTAEGPATVIGLGPTSPAPWAARTSE